MKIYQFDYAPMGDVPFGDVPWVVSAARDVLEQKTHNVEDRGTQLLCRQAVEGSLRPTQQKDPIAAGFMDAGLLAGTRMRLVAASVEYTGISLPYGDCYKTQNPAGIFSRQRYVEEWDIPIYITCHPQYRAVALWVQIIEEESLAACQQAFYYLLHGVEEKLVESELVRERLRTVCAFGNLMG
ncbi:MAG: hypothetical protein Q8Q10_02235 [bacterium]|nr:hypothetical protein [bacterium]